MNTLRPCGCKGCRTCILCETKFNIEPKDLGLDRNKSYVYCPYCNKAYRGWDVNYSEHPNHEGNSIEFPGIYIQFDFLSTEEEENLMKAIDEVPWDISQSGRRKQNYGPKTNFKKRKIVPGSFNGFPRCSKFIQDKFNSVSLLKGYETIEQCSLEYDPSKGSSIDPHIDDCWIWGERIITVNCLSDSILTLTPYKGDKKKYNLLDAESYSLVVGADGSLNLSGIRDDCNALRESMKTSLPDVVVRVPMPRKSLLVIYGEARYHWEHCVLREDITERRVCLAYREFTPPYFRDGPYGAIGDAIREKSKNFWDHKEVYDVNIQNM